MLSAMLWDPIEERFEPSRLAALCLTTRVLATTHYDLLYLLRLATIYYYSYY